MKDSTRQQIESIWHKFQYTLPNTPRTSKLFLDFFPKGFEFTTLSSVQTRYYDDLIVCKTLLASLVTLYDDFIDEPNMRDVDFGNTFVKNTI